MFLFDSVSCEYIFKMRDGDNSSYRLVMRESYCEADRHDRDPEHVMIMIKVTELKRCGHSSSHASLHLMAAIGRFCGLQPCGLVDP
jgi:hypothetical protein